MRKFEKPQIRSVKAKKSNFSSVKIQALYSKSFLFMEKRILKFSPFGSKRPRLYFTMF